MNNIYVDSEQLLNCALNLKKDATNILTTFQNECSHAITAGNECLRVSGLDSSAVNTSLNKIFTNTYDQLMLLANFLATNVAQEYDLTTQAIAKSFNQEFANEIASLLGITVGTVTGGATGIGTNISSSSGIAGGYTGGSGYFGGTCGSSSSIGSQKTSPYPNGNQTGQVNLTNLTAEEKAKLEAAGYKWQCGPDGCGWHKTDPNTGQPILAGSNDLNKMYGILGADKNGKYKPISSPSGPGRDPSTKNIQESNDPSSSSKSGVTTRHEKITTSSGKTITRTISTPTADSTPGYSRDAMSNASKDYNYTRLHDSSQKDNPAFHRTVTTPSGKTITQVKTIPNAGSTPGYVRDAKPSNTRTKVYDSSTKSNSKWA